MCSDEDKWNQTDGLTEKDTKVFICFDTMHKFERNAALRNQRQKTN